MKTYGSLQRSQRLYKEAIKSYTGAIEAAKIEQYTEAIWPILFLRGISFERSKNWDLAEEDFISALELRPDQPQILNYMGYSLLERKEKLDQAMRMILLVTSNLHPISKLTAFQVNQSWKEQKTCDGHSLTSLRSKSSSTSVKHNHIL